MMVIKKILRSVIRVLKGLEQWAGEEPPKKADARGPEAETSQEVHAVWDYLAPKENTQAAHLVTVVGFEEWVEMIEIKRRIKELFGMDYKNERSLYPYIKTFVDCGLFECTDIGGKRKWKKKALLLKLRAAETGKEKESEKAEEKSR